MIKNAAKVISIAIVLTMVLGAFTVMLSVGSARTSAVETVSVADPYPMDIDPQMKAQQLDFSAISGEMAILGAMVYAPGDIYNVGDQALYLLGSNGKWYYNDTDPSDYMLFEKKAERQWCEVWVATDLTFFPGDPRNDGRVVITDEQAAYMADQFNDTIYPTMTENFIAPPANDGSNSVPAMDDEPFFGTNVSGRVMIMIFNIVDDNFFYPVYPSYVAGYFSPGMDAYYDRNIIHIDCWDWDNRTGEQPTRPDGRNLSFLYEGVVAHEYQHLLNDFLNPTQDTFLNEGCADFAIFLCGYGVSWDHINAFLYTPDNSLIEWSDQGDLNILADYGAAHLYVLWLYDHFGIEFVVKLVNSTWDGETFNGVAAVEAAFENLGYTKWDFDRSFNSWRLANIIQSDSPGNGLYNYVSLDLADARLGGPLVNTYDPTEDYAQSGGSYVESAAWEFGKTITSKGIVLDSGKVGSYGTDYIYVGRELSEPARPIGWFAGLNTFELKFAFNGDKDVKQGWQMVDVPIETTEVLFQDDFNHDGALPGWNLMSVGEYSSPWDAYLNPYVDEPDNYFAMSYGKIPAAVGLPIDEWMMMSNGFSTLGYDHLELTMKNDFQTYFANSQIAIIYFSIDGGDTWKALTSFTQDSVTRYLPNPFQNGYANVAISADDIAGFSDVRLAFRYFTDNANAASRWWAFDDLMVSAVNTTPMWWSDRGDLVDYRLVGTLDLSGFAVDDEVTLGLDTMWSLEDLWDFGFVQVSNNSGESWESLEGTFTTTDHDPSAMESIVAELPGITGMNPNWGMPGWAALDHAEYDLDDYAGQVVDVRFRVMTVGSPGTELEFAL